MENKTQAQPLLEGKRSGMSESGVPPSTHGPPHMENTGKLPPTIIKYLALSLYPEELQKFVTLMLYLVTGSPPPQALTAIVNNIACTAHSQTCSLVARDTGTTNRNHESAPRVQASPVFTAGDPAALHLALI